MRNQEKAGLIMIVDDNPNNLQLLGQILQNEGYHLSFSREGKKAIEIINKIKPDLVLLDIVMAGMDGYEVCRRLKQSPGTKDIPIIFLTAKTESEDIVKGFSAGAVDYISKPLKTEELLARVRTQLELKFHRTQLEELVKERTRELQDLLTEKELLLNEVNHRIGNNLQFISALFYLQMAQYDDEKIKKLLLDYRNRIQSIETIHKMLYKENNFINIDFVTFIRTLKNNLFEVFNISKETIGFSVNVDNFTININLAVPWGLIINEIISLFLKYAVKNKVYEKITFSLTRKENNQYTITIISKYVEMIGNVLQDKELFEYQLLLMMLKQTQGSLQNESGRLTFEFDNPDIITYNDMSGQ